MVGVIAVLSAFALVTVSHLLTSTNTTTQTPPTLSIFYGSESVQVQSWLAKNFSYTASNIPVITGHFSASGGGSDNNIRILVLTIANFTQFKRTGTVNAYYSSGAVSSGTLNVNLPSGNGEYTFVIDNTFDSIQSKSVFVNASLLV